MLHMVSLILMMVASHMQIWWPRLSHHKSFIHVSHNAIVPYSTCSMSTSKHFSMNPNDCTVMSRWVKIKPTHKLLCIYHVYHPSTLFNINYSINMTKSKYGKRSNQSFTGWQVFSYSNPSLKGHSLERTPLYKGNKFLAPNTGLNNLCPTDQHKMAYKHIYATLCRQKFVNPVCEDYLCF